MSAHRPELKRQSSELFLGVGTACELRLISVDDVNEIFKVAVLVHCHFENPNYCRASGNPAEDEFVRDKKYDVDEYYVPKISLTNVIESQWEDDEVTVRVNRCTGIIWTTNKNTYDINESLELFSFPFDRQLFRVCFKSPNAALQEWALPVDILDLDPVMKNGKVISENDSKYFVSCEMNSWSMVDLQVTLDQRDPDPVSLTAAEFEIAIMAERNPIYYLNNYVVVMYIIVLLNIGNMALSLTEQVGERLAASLTLLLSAVAFKFVLGSTLPKVAYSTWADAYVRISFITLFIGCAENFFAAPKVWCSSRYFDSGDATAVLAGVESCIADNALAATKLDVIFQSLFIVWWTLVNLVAAIVCYFPTLVQPSWKYVLENQIGDTEATTRRTNDIILLIGDDEDDDDDEGDH
ncbi:Betaine receptor acr-23 [Hondaea fermentalgiana]|uniref:Betaine receptor acr-23 n=1 Tax=Hondaea fermentalgiana TaxID=2315210 RepID=A0A2R5GNU2_9STRA|nr:Betaine receptor acr-23 [Hondaea fermentalgiana]|eukprot:GBG29971.1 Betaine receptor acr-23 [Hondaea fermentalgiana]